MLVAGSKGVFRPLHFHRYNACRHGSQPFRSKMHTGTTITATPNARLSRRESAPAVSSTAPPSVAAEAPHSGLFSSPPLCAARASAPVTLVSAVRSADGSENRAASARALKAGFSVSCIASCSLVSRTSFQVDVSLSYTTSSLQNSRNCNHEIFSFLVPPCRIRISGPGNGYPSKRIRVQSAEFRDEPVVEKKRRRQRDTHSTWRISKRKHIPILHDPCILLTTPGTRLRETGGLNAEQN